MILKRFFQLPNRPKPLPLLPFASVSVSPVEQPQIFGDEGGGEAALHDALVEVRVRAHRLARRHQGVRHHEDRTLLVFIFMRRKGKTGVADELDRLLMYGHL
jgi:hypothetical protein